MLRRGQNGSSIPIARFVGSMQSPNESRTEGRDKRRILAEGLEGAAPPDVLRHAHRGGEGPMNIGSQQFAGRDAPCSLHQVQVAGGAQADVVRTDGGSSHIAVAMHSIHALEERNPKPARQRLPLYPSDHLRTGASIITCRST